MIRTALTAGVAALALIGCGGSNDNEGGSNSPGVQAQAGTSDLVSCADLFGQTVDADTFNALCVGEGGRVQAYGTVSKVCVDGSMLLWNDLGIQEPGGTFEPWPSTGERAANDAQWAKCAGN